MGLRLTIDQTLQWDIFEADKKQANLKQAFEKDVPHALFHLAASKVDHRSSPPLHYWQDFASKFLTELCHLPQEKPFTPIPPPLDISNILLNAPPMPGGESLTLDVLRKIWTDLNHWVVTALGGDLLPPAGRPCGSRFRTGSPAPTWSPPGPPASPQARPQSPPALFNRSM